METQTQQSSSICNRCKVKQGEFTCNECTPFNTFCANCDAYVHSLPSKRNHNRLPLNSRNKISQMTSINMSQVDTSIPFSNRSLQDTYVMENVSSPQSQNYINEIRKIFEGEKEELINKNFLLQKSLNSTSDSLNQRIADLENQISEMNSKNAMEIKLLIENHEADLKRIVAEKDNQINYLYNQNFELEKANDELVHKVNEYADLVNQNKIIYGDKLTNYENTINSLHEDIDDIKNFYEKKISFFTSNFSSEKNKIINSYENTIEKLNIGYKDSKNKYISVINQRDIEIKELIMNHRNDTDKLNSTIAELKATIDSLRDDQEKLMKMNNEQKAEIDTLNESLERSKKEIKFHIREKSKIEKDSEVLQKDLSQLKVQNEKMHRLTHGKFRRQKSTEK